MALAQVPERTLAEAAAELGALYLDLYAKGALPLGEWALPRREATADFLGALADVYGTDTERQRKFAPNYFNRFDFYRSAFAAVIPALKRAALRFAKESLDKEDLALRALALRVGNLAVAQALSEAARRVGQKMGGYGTEYGREAYRKLDETAREENYTSQQHYYARRILELELEDRRRTYRARLAAAVADEQNDDLSVLMAHPESPQIFEAYAKAPSLGARVARELIGGATVDLDAFRDEVTAAAPDHVWRYPSLITGGVAALGLLKVDGFPEFAVDIGKVLGQGVEEKIIGGLGIVVLGLGIVFTGGAAGVVVGVLDLALTGTSGAFSYLKEREQELGASGTSFRAESERVASRTYYEETLLAGAAGLLSGLALVGEARQALRAARGREAGELTQASRLSLDRRDRSDRYFTRSKSPEIAGERVNARPRFNRDDIRANAKKARGTDRVGTPDLSSQRMVANRNRNKVETTTRAGIADEFTGADVEARSAAATEGTRLGRQDDFALDLTSDTSPSPHEFGMGNDFNLLDIENAPDVTGPTAPELSSLKRGSKSTGRVFDESDQLYGIFYRVDEPNPPELQKWAREQLALGTPDPIIPSILVTEKNPGTLEHVVAVELIKQFEGFERLPKELQGVILHMRENLMAVSSVVNRKRGSMPFSLFEGLEGHAIPPTVRAKLIQREREVAELIQQRINQILKDQWEKRGLVNRIAAAPTSASAARGLGFPSAPRTLFRSATPAGDAPAPSLDELWKKAATTAAARQTDAGADAGAEGDAGADAGAFGGSWPAADAGL